MNVLQKTEVWLRAEILEHIANVYGMPGQAREAASVRRMKEYSEALAKIREVEHVLSSKKNAEVNKKVRIRTWEYHKARARERAKKKAEKKKKPKKKTKRKHK